MSIELIRGELERLFSLEEMQALANDLLGFPPQQVGGTASSASFARALTDHCHERDAVAALIDAVTGVRDEASPKLQKFATDVLQAPVELKRGARLGAFEVVRKLGAGPNGTVYACTRDGGAKTVKFLHNAAIHDKSAVHRFLTRNRMLARVDDAHLPRGIEAGLIEHTPFVAYDTVDAKPLAPRVARVGALHINEARVLLRGVLFALRALHAAGIVHGALKLENVLVAKGDDGPKVVLIDAGGDLLRSAWIHSDVGHGGAGRIKGLAPEQLQGHGTRPESDLYGFGALLFEILTGKPPFEAATATATAVAHLSMPPRRAGDAAPKGWVTDALDDLAAKLLEKNHALRPSIEEALEAIGSVERRDKVSNDEVVEAIDALVADPTDGSTAIGLELMLERGADTRQVADAFLMAADLLDPDEAAAAARVEESSVAVAEVKAEAARDRAVEQKKSLLFRAARLFDQKLSDHTKAEEIYRWLLDLAPDDEVAQNGYEGALRAQEKLEEIVEYYLDIGENHPQHSKRALALNKIGHLYAGPLDEKDQAVFAFAQALAQDVQNDGFAEDLERAAGSDMQLWAEAMQALHEASEHPKIPPEALVTLFMRLGDWYTSKIQRPDLALPCYQSVLTHDPAHEGAMAGMTTVYRRAQQWPELVATLLLRVERATTPSRARDLRAEAAEIFDTRLGDIGRARDLYEENLQSDPGHQKTVEALESIYQRNDDYGGYVKILDRQASALTGTARAETLCRIGELAEDQLNDLAEAERRFLAALELDPGNMTGLRGLDRVLNRQGRYQDLLANLERQLLVAATPRQKINLFTRIAGIYDEEYLDHEKAASYLEQVLALDGGHEGALTALMRHYRALDRWDDVIDLYDRSLRVATDDDKRVALLLAQGRVLLDFGSPERARLAYENVLQIDAANATALESLATVRAATGDAMAALTAVDALAEKADEGAPRADLWVRAAKICEEAGDVDGAIMRYKRALDAQSDHAEAAKALRGAYLGRGDAQGAVDLIRAEIDRTDGKIARARLNAELATIRRDKLNDVDGGREAAVAALVDDPTNIEALMLLGDTAFAAEGYREAVDRYGSLAGRTDVLEPEVARSVLTRYVDALRQTGSTAKAKRHVPKLLELAGDDLDARRRAALVYLDAEAYTEAVPIYDALCESHLDALTKTERGDVLMEFGRALRKTGERARAIEPLQAAMELRPDAPEPVEELAQVYVELERWKDVVAVKRRRAEVTTGDEKTELLVAVGDVEAEQLQDRTAAAATFVEAMEASPDNRKVLTRLMRLYSEEKDWGKLVDVVLRLGEGVEDPAQKIKYIQTAAGVASRQLEDYDAAVRYLDMVLELDPDNQKAIGDKIDALQKKEDHAGLIDYLLRRADAIDEVKAKIKLTQEVAKIAMEKLGDAPAALEHMERVVGYGAQLGDDTAHVKLVIEAAGFAYEKAGDEPAAVKYLDQALALAGDDAGIAFAAAKTAMDKYANDEAAERFLRRTLELTPDNIDALQRSIQLRERAEDYAGVVQYLELALDQARKQNNPQATLQLLERMARLNLDKLDDVDTAIGYLERAFEVDPGDLSRVERLAVLYAEHTDRYYDKAVGAQTALVKNNAFEPGGYRKLRKLFTEGKEADPAWCTCQALYVLNSAEPDEERFFTRMRAETAAEAQASLGDEDWAASITHPWCDASVTEIFRLIEPAVFAKNADPLEALGYQTAYALDLTMHPYPISRTLYYTGGVLGMEVPMTFQNIKDEGGISFLHANPPCIVLGKAALAAELPTQAAAFIAARHLTYYRPGFYIRHLVPSGTGMRAWLFAAVRMFHDQFPVAEEMETQVAENQEIIRQYIPGHLREHLADPVNRLLQSGSIDLKRWVAGVDLTADRAGFLVAHDLEIATEMVKATEEDSSAINHRDRVKELTLFGVDRKYFDLRRKLGINIDA
ncbi:MAG: tetratricopeptide repeat protein [Myxococcota bacterium]